MPCSPSAVFTNSQITYPLYRDFSPTKHVSFIQKHNSQSMDDLANKWSKIKIATFHYWDVTWTTCVESPAIQLFI